jgi:hypothetical protein
LLKWLEGNLTKVLGPKNGEILNEAKVINADGDDLYTVKYLDGLEEARVPAVLIREYGTIPARDPEPPVHKVGTRVEVHFQCHLEKARRRLRSQIERLERLVAKVPAPPNPDVLGAPSASIKVVMRSCVKASNDFRSKSEAGFEKLLQAWESARQKHTTALRPQLGSPDAASELQKLVAKEQKRSLEVREAVLKFKGKLLEAEANNAKSAVDRLSSILKTNAMILDKMILRDDLISLPGDELILPKRKSLKRLKKAVSSGHGAAPSEKADEEEDDAAPVNTGRKWEKRVWAAFDLEAIKSQMLMDMPPPRELTEAEVQAQREEEEKAKKDKKKAAPAKKGSAAEEELEVKPTLNEVELWEKRTKEESQFESNVTTAHRCLVKTAEEELAAYSEMFRTSSLNLRQKYQDLWEKEAAWEKKWQSLVQDLTKLTAEE